jgi:hypothetical protein
MASDSKEEKKRRKQEKKQKKEEKKAKKKRKRSSLESSASVAASATSATSEQDLPSSKSTPTPSTAERTKKSKQRHTNTNSNSNININKNPESPFQKKNVSMMLSLPPESLSNTPKAMHQAMQAMLLHYSDGLGGVLLSFDNIQLDTSKNGGGYGKILHEFPEIHYYITVDVLVFQPVTKSGAGSGSSSGGGTSTGTGATSGSKLKAVVNETFPSHVGLLVHELFNASVSAECLREAGFTFDVDLNEWSSSSGSGSSDEGGHGHISEGDCMEIVVEKVHECSGLMSLECKDPVLVEDTRVLA